MAGPPSWRVAVFGSSEPRPGEAAYETARQVGRLLGREGITVVTGGYGGVMEAACRGARENGGKAIGVTSSALFSHRQPNPYLDVHEDRPDLLSRTRTLIDLSDGFIILPGRSGTLAEAVLLWALQRAGVHDRPRVMIGQRWRDLLAQLARLDVLEPALLRDTPVVDGPEEAVDLLLRNLGDHRGEGS
jgi:uncharacterized protein (TIGR00730 family)